MLRTLGGNRRSHTARNATASLSRKTARCPPMLQISSRLSLRVLDAVLLCERVLLSDDSKAEWLFSARLWEPD